MHHLGEQSTRELEPQKIPSHSEISRIMSAMGRRGGKKSAKARMEKISPEQRSEIAANAARAMWARRKATRGD